MSGYEYHEEDDVDRDVVGHAWNDTLHSRANVPTKRENQAQSGKASRNAYAFKRMMQDPNKVRRQSRKGSATVYELPEV